MLQYITEERLKDYEETIHPYVEYKGKHLKGGTLHVTKSGHTLQRVLSSKTKKPYYIASKRFGQESRVHHSLGSLRSFLKTVHNESKMKNFKSYIEESNSPYSKYLDAIKKYVKSSKILPNGNLIHVLHTGHELSVYHGQSETGRKMQYVVRSKHNHIAVHKSLSSLKRHLKEMEYE